MSFVRLAFCVYLAVAVATPGFTQSDPMKLHIELNRVQDVEAACRITFVAHNETGRQIDRAVFETVIFDATGSVDRLTLFDFRDMPADRVRVRQFDLPGITCQSLGQVLFNGANSCVEQGEEIGVCNSALSTSSRVDVELLG